MASGDKLAYARYAALLSRIVVLAYAAVGWTNRLKTGDDRFLVAVLKTSLDWGLERH